MSGIKITTTFPPEFYDWVKDVYPVWLQLPQDALSGLVPFNSAKSPLHLDYATNTAALSGSLIFQNLRTFLNLIDEDQIQLLPDDTMASDSLELLLDGTVWPHYDVEGVKQLPRPLHEETICRLDFLKALAIASGLINLSDNRLEITQSGRLLLAHKVERQMVRKVFEAAFSKVNPRTLTKLAHPWVHEQAGVVFWGLSIVGVTPRSAEELARYCFVPTKELFESRLRSPNIYMRAVFLDPLIWFGLLETHETESTESNPAGLMYQKSPVFDSFFHFEIERLLPVERAN
jgi:hypothetical protein